MLNYNRISNKLLQHLPINMLQDNGFLFMWVVKSCYIHALRMMEKWGYKFVSIT
jgi:N6-adenosine-specific RNA methylase IME4